MAFPAKIDFRNTAAFGGGNDAGETHCIAAGGGGMEAYATPLRDGFNMGFTTNAFSAGSRDRSTVPAAKFAGIAFNEAANQCTFKLELDATGQHTIRAALGDYDNAQTVVVQFLDDTSVISTITSSTSAADRFLDATGVERTSANWDANNVALTHTFTTNILNVKIGNNAATATGFISYLEVSAVISTTPPKVIGGGVGGGTGAVIG
jgi:hypothetical protein